MNWDIALDILIKALGSTLATIIITFASILFAKLKTKIGEARLNNYIDRCVRAAEQLFPNLNGKTGPEKYEYVKNLIIQKFPKQANNPYLKALIEGAVYAVSQQTKQLQKTQQTTNTISSF